MLYENLAGLVALSIVLQLVSAVAVGLRFFSRHLQGAGYGIDDWLIILGLLFATGIFTTQIYGTATHAFGVPLSATAADPVATDQRFGITRHLELALFVLSILSLTFVKLSTVFLYRRIFSGRGWFGIISSIYIVILVIWGIAFLIAIVAECGTHLSALFGTPEVYFARCNYAMRIGWGNTISDAITDLITVLLPLPMVARLHCSMQRKLQILAVFAISIISVAASSAKSGVFIRKTLAVYRDDPIIVVTQLSVWTYVEIQVAIFAACAITFRPVYARINQSACISYLRRSFAGSSSIIMRRLRRNMVSEKLSVHSRADTDSSTQNSIICERTFTVHEEYAPASGKAIPNWDQPDRMHRWFGN